MSNRTLRVNELIQRELSAILRQRHQSEAVAVTITEIRVSPDLRDARVFVSVIGSILAVLAVTAFWTFEAFRRHAAAPKTL